MRSMGYCVDLVSHPIPSGYINRDKAISGGGGIPLTVFWAVQWEFWKLF